jgi:spore coat protein U domain-containing protein, fimbrial subunit CupE1/2/3/6
MRMSAIIICCALLVPTVVHAATSAAIVSVDATVITKNSCKFQTGPGNIAFSLDPLNPVNVSAQDSSNILVRCSGSGDPATFSISDDGGLHDVVAGQKQLMATIVGVPHYIPYTMGYSPTTIPHNTDVQLTVSVSVPGSSYVNAYAGAYTDTVTLTITP